MIIPKHYNYIGIFLTFKCNMKCDYCINRYGTKPMYKDIPGKEWVKIINNIKTTKDLPITLSGGEPTLHKDFYYIINHIDKNINIDLLTNGTFNEVEFIKNISPKRLKRPSMYASIRFSYHPGYTDKKQLLDKVALMKKMGYSVGIWAVEHPSYFNDVHLTKFPAMIRGIDYRIKDFLGEHNGVMYGNYKYPEAVDGMAKKCKCKGSELLIAPDGSLHRCHYYLYANKKGYANAMDKKVELPHTYQECNKCGLCSPCDIKVKYNRFQIMGHCSVKIKDIK